MTNNSSLSLDPLFEPRGVVIVGASTHPGKFGFVSLHNLLSAGYTGGVYATNRDGAEVLGIQAVPSIADLPDEPIDLAFLCTPAAANVDIVRQCGERGIGAAFIAGGGYGEAGEAGLAAQDELVAAAAEAGVRIIGPNGQGVVSTPIRLCAQIVAPYPPAGSIAVASQSGNLVSTFMNYSVATGVGISRAVSAGNAAMTSVIDLLEWYADDDATNVILAYVEGISDGRDFFDRIRAVAARKPVVLVKGGASSEGARAAASHTGSLASDDAVFDGMARQAGVVRARTVEEAFDTAASFATQPMPAGGRTAVVTSVGGWGVMTADAMADSSLELVALPDDLIEAIDGELPPRWSRNNPIDMAGGETRETVPNLLEIVAGHDAVDAVLYMGLGIQANQAALMADGPFYPDHGLERIVDFHRRQDRRYAEAGGEVSHRHGKPVIYATELAVADPTNPGPAAIREAGRLCLPSAARAVRVLDHLRWYSAFHRARSNPVVARTET
jgi:acetyltransferase